MGHFNPPFLILPVFQNQIFFGDFSEIHYLKFNSSPPVKLHLSFGSRPQIIHR